MKPEFRLKDTDKNVGISLLPTLLHPRSVGFLELASADPFEMPSIQFNYLDHDDDVAVLVHGIRLSQKIAYAKGFSSYVVESFVNPALNAKFMRDTGAKEVPTATESLDDPKWDAYLEFLVRHTSITVYHSVCKHHATCVVQHATCNMQHATCRWEHVQWVATSTCTSLIMTLCAHPSSK